MSRSVQYDWLFTTVALFAVAVFFGCGGVTGGEPGTVVAADRTTRSLRLGQTDTPNSPVAISAAVDTRESFVVLDRDLTSGGIEQVLYRSGQGEVVSIVVSSDGRPLSAQTATAQVTFSNYTDITVDVTITSQGVVMGSLTVALQNDVRDILQSGNSRSPARSSYRVLSDQAIRNILRGAVVAIRTFGCAGVSVEESIDVGPQFARLAEASCGSLLVSTVRTVVQDQEEPLETLFTTDLPDSMNCNFASEGDFSSASNCASDIGGQLVTEVLFETPLVGSVVQDSVQSDAALAGQHPELFDPDNGAPLPTPTPLPSPSPSPGPAPRPTVTPSPSPTPTPTPTGTPLPSPSPSPSPTPTASEEIPEPPDPSEPEPDMP